MNLYSRSCIPITHKALGIWSRQYHVRKAPEPIPTEIVQLLGSFASHPPLPISLAKLLSFGRPLTSKSLLNSVSYVCTPQLLT